MRGQRKTWDGKLLLYPIYYFSALVVHEVQLNYFFASKPVTAKCNVSMCDGGEQPGISHLICDTEPGTSATCVIYSFFVSAPQFTN